MIGNRGTLDTGAAISLQFYLVDAIGTEITQYLTVECGGDSMRWRPEFRATTLGVGLAASGSALAYVLAGGHWAAAGAVVGAVTGAFAPTVYDAIRSREFRREKLRSTIERAFSESMARLLDPRLETVDFLGRKNELVQLEAWCMSDGLDRLRIITGAGGVGKTRLAVELSDRMRTRDWYCERVADGKEGISIAALDAETRSQALLVVDYAETRVQLREMLTALAGNQGRNTRVLLLARSTGDWWYQLGVGNPELWDLIQAAEAAKINLSTAIDNEFSDADIVALAVDSFARRLGLPARTVEISGYNGATPRRVLDLHVAALLAVLDNESPEPVEVDIDKVFDELLRHEQHFWYETARVNRLTEGPSGLPLQALRQIVAASCLLGAATAEDARNLSDRVPGMTSSLTIANWLRDLYPPSLGDPDWIGLLQPDRLAELHTVEELLASPEFARKCLSSLNTRQARRAITFLARASSDYPKAERLLSQALPDVADFIPELDAPPETLTAIYNAIPKHTVILASAAAAVIQRIVDLLPADCDPEQRARWMSGLGLRLSNVGRLVEAMSATEYAVAINRELVAVNPDHNTSEFANTLADLGDRFSALGRPADALRVTEEAVAIRRRLSATDPDNQQPELAATLDRLGTQFWRLGRPADALPVTEEAVAIRRRLSASDPNRYQPDLASSLDNRSLSFSALGRPADALPLTEEAVAIYRELAASDPDRYRPDLALALSNLSVRLSAVGRSPDALPAAEESVSIRRELAVKNPDAYSAALADSLDNLAIEFWRQGRPADSVPLTEQAIDIYRNLAAANPGAYRADLAGALDNLGVWLSETGRPADALPFTEEALTISRELATVNPGRHRADLAACLDNLSVRLSQLSRSEEALAKGEEALEIYRELAAATPESNRDGFAETLRNLASRYLELGRPAEAAPLLDEAVAIYRGLVAANADRYRLELADSLDMIGEIFGSLGRNADANAAESEAARIRAGGG